MARKRGGLAGIWDRNKNIITPVATGLVGAFGSPIAAAALGAAMRGLDRPGKAGIGIDPFAAVKGGVEGYAAGSLGQSAKKGVANLFAPKMAPGAQQLAAGTQMMNEGLASIPNLTAPSAPSLAGAGLPSMPSLPEVNMPARIGVTPSAAAPSPGAAPRSVTAPGGGAVAGGTQDKPQGRIARLLSGVRENWEPLSGIAEAVGGTMSGQQANAINQQQADLNRMRMELERQKFETEQESRRRLTQLLMPLLQAQMTNVLPPNPVASR